MTDQILNRIKNLHNPPPQLPTTPSNLGEGGEDDLSVGSARSTASMSNAATDVFKMISPHLPPIDAPRVLRLISDAFAKAQSRISTAEAKRDTVSTRLRQSESARRNEEKIAADKAKHYNETVKEVRRQRDEAMEEVNKLHHQIQTMKVHSSVLTATESLNAPAAPATAPTAINNNMRIALQKEFDEKKNLLEQRWDHALNLVTEQMKKQRDEQVALAVSKFDVEQRLKFQAEISKGLERVEAAARQEVSDLTKLALKMHSTIESQNEKVAKLTEELNDLRTGSETMHKIQHTATVAAAEMTAEKELEHERMKQKLAQSNVLIDELQMQVETWKGKSDGDWFRDRMQDPKTGHAKYIDTGGRNEKGAIKNSMRLVAEEENLRSRRKEAINLAHSMGRNSSPSKKVTSNYSNYMSAAVAATADDSISLVSSNASIPVDQSLHRRDLSNNATIHSVPFFGDASGGGAKRVELSTNQPSSLQEYVGHPRLDALLSSF